MLGGLLIEEEGLTVFEIGLLLEVFGARREQTGETCVKKNFMIGRSHQKLTDQNNRGLWHVSGEEIILQNFGRET